MERLSDVVSAKQAALRVRRLQRICASSGLDALLFIAGMDGKYHAGTQQALSFLFCGKSGRDVVDAIQLPECLEDIVLIVTKESIAVFCHEQSYAELAKLIIPCCDVNFVCPSPAEAEDPDVYEELKIAAFVQLLRTHKRIGVPLSVEMRDGQHVVGDVHEIDLWPLVQAYGLEGVGKPGFFTQNFLVESIQKQAQQTYCELDALAVKHLLQQNVINMAKHWQEVSIGIAETLPSNLTELAVASPLLSFFTHGTIRNAVEVRQVVTMPPRVLFGSNSNNDTERSGSFKVADVPISAGYPPIHMTLEAADPKSPMRAARTFFLTRGTLVKDAFADGDSLGGSSSVPVPLASSSHDLQHLTQLYAALVSAARVAMNVFTTQEGATSKSARAAAEHELLRCTANCGMALSEGDVQQNLQFALWSADHTNRVSGEARQYSRKVKVLQMSLRNIISTAPQHPGALLGAVTYSDSFLEVQGGLGEEPTLLVLTSAIPVCKFYSCDMAEVRAASAAHRNLAAALGHSGQASAAAPAPSMALRASTQQRTSAGLPAPLGALLSTGGGEEAVLFTGASLLPAILGFVRFFSRGLVFSSRTTNLLALDLQQDVASVAIQHMECSQLGLPAIGDALVLRGKSSACCLAPACFLTDTVHLVLPLASLSPMNRRQLLLKVLPVWQQTCREAGVAWEKDIQPGTCFGPALYPHQCLTLQCSTKRWPLLEMDDAVERALSRLDRLELAAAYPPDLDVEGILLRSPFQRLSGGAPQQPCLAETTATMALSAAPESIVSVILVVGLPGADQRMVAGALLQMVGSSACVQLHHPAQGAAFDPKVLEQDLMGAVAALREMPGPSATIILTTACYSGMAAQLRALTQALQFKEGTCALAATITSVSTAAFYEDDSCCQCLPGVLAQAAPGLVDLIVLSGAQNCSRVQALLNLHNPHAPIVRATWAAVTQAAARLISSQADRLSRLQDLKLAQLRFCATSTAPRGLLCGSLQCVWLQFSGSIDLQLLRTRLQELGGSSNLSQSSTAQRKVPLEVCGPDETSEHAIYFSALLRLEPDGPVKEVTAVRGSDVVVMEHGQDARQLQGRPAWFKHQQPDGIKVGGEVLSVGAGVTAAKLSVLLQSCLTQAAGDSQVAPATLTAVELQDIQEQHRFDALPEGYYFTGSSYVDSYGDYSQHHPNMQQFVAQHVLQREKQAAHGSAVHTVPFRVIEVSEVCLGE